MDSLEEEDLAPSQWSGMEETTSTGEPPLSSKLAASEQVFSLNESEGALLGEMPSVTEVPSPAPSLTLNLPPPPNRRFLARAGKARLYVMGEGQPFDLAVDAIVIPSGIQKEIGGSLAPYAQSFLGNSWSDFESAIRSKFGKSPLAEAPLFFPINPPDGHHLRILIAATAWTVSFDDVTLEGVERAVRAVIARSKDHSVRCLAIPLLGASDGLTPVRVVRSILAAAQSALPEAPWIQEVTVIAQEEDAYQEAIALFTRAPQRFANDLPGGEDLLEVASEIQALTDILLLKSLEPPLAVGILGGWGSGKSFAMDLMRRHIQRIRSLPANGGWASQGVGEYVGHVYPITFDAWTYAKSNLWASLMQTIFLELSRQVHLELRIRERLGTSPAPDLEGNLWLAFQTVNDRDRNALLGEKSLAEHFQELSKPETWLDSDVGKALWEAVAKVREEQQKVLEKKQAEAVQVATEIEQKKAELEQQVDEELAAKAYKIAWEGAAGSVKALALKVVKETPGGAQAIQNGKEIQEFLGLVGADRKAVPMGFRNFQDALARNPVVITAAVVTALAFGGLSYGLWNKLPSLAPVVAWLGPILALLAGAARTASSWRAQVANAWRGLEREVRTAESRVEREREAILQQKLQKSPDAQALRDLEEKRRRLETEIQRLRQQIGFTADYVSVADLVQARLNKAEYEGELGLLHRVQSDLEELSRALCPSGDPAHLAALKEQFPRGPARIVLFIDDLDRCPPDRVVEVLEAVQLLVKTPLFVVVLAMDVRYITRALEKVYKDILLRRGSPCGLDYIEKIIQLPYSIRPIDAAHVERFLRGQMEIQPEKAEGQAPVPFQQPSQRPDGTSSSLVARPAEEAKPLSPEVVTFTVEELGWIKACCERLPLSPRAVKRVVNALKLLKIVWFRPNRHIPPEPEVQQAFVALLALSAAYPNGMRAAFASLPERVPQTGPPLELLTDLQSILRSDLVQSACARDEIADLQRNVTLVPANAKVPSHLRVTLELVRSLSFVAEIGFDPADERDPALRVKAD